MNLLQETIESIKDSGHSPSDIMYIGSRDGYSCTWEEFQTLANREYDDGFGGAEVADNLEIIFTDGSGMTRGEYDGSEWWQYSKPFIMPKETKPITSLFPNDYSGKLF
jgi:hypothetical protein